MVSEVIATSNSSIMPDPKVDRQGKEDIRVTSAVIPVIGEIEESGRENFSKICMSGVSSMASHSRCNIMCCLLYAGCVTSVLRCFGKIK